MRCPSTRGEVRWLVGLATFSPSGGKCHRGGGSATSSIHPFFYYSPPQSPSLRVLLARRWSISFHPSSPLPARCTVCHRGSSRRTSARILLASGKVAIPSRKSRLDTALDRPSRRVEHRTRAIKTSREQFVPLTSTRPGSTYLGRRGQFFSQCSGKHACAIDLAARGSRAALPPRVCCPPSHDSLEASPETVIHHPLL